MELRSWLVAVTLAAVAVPGAGPPGAAAAPASSPAVPDRWVTLVTGDRVLVRPGPPLDTVLQVAPAKGREEMAFRQIQEYGDVFVIPGDATPLVAAGTVDRRLFNVSKLIDFGYDDRSRGDLPLIVTWASRQQSAARSMLSAIGTTLTRELPSVDGAATRAGKDRAVEFWRGVRPAAGRGSLAGGVSSIRLDGPVRATLDHSVPQIGAPAAWQRGHRGGGTTVAVLDTGIDRTHPDLADAVTAERDFTESASGPHDVHGHGTHVAATITGSGAASAGRYAGVAPDARLVNVKVLDDEGSGLDSWVLEGMEWAAGTGAKVVNMSLGDPWPSDGSDLLSHAVNRLTAQRGTLFVVSAGNSGPDDGSIGSPAAADAALTVGAVTGEDELADFSSRGPRLGDAAVKPDITAPGVGIVAARAEGSELGEPVGDGYQRLSGTSMAAPHVAGAAAILAGQHPDLTGPELKALLTGSATPNTRSTVYQQGSGRVDVARATGQSIFSQPASVNNGIARWPHQDDVPTERTVEYQNVTATPVTLDLSPELRDPTGAAAPAGMFTVEPRRVTVPAGGVASVSLTTDTRVAAPDGAYDGVLIATGSDQTVVRTPVGVVREVESYDVTVTMLDRQGRPTPDNWLRFVDLAAQRAWIHHDPSGTVVARLPKGRHYFEADVGAYDGVTPGAEMQAVEPEVLVDRDTRLTVDARDGRPHGNTVEQPTARPVNTVLSFQRFTPWGDTGGGVFGRAERLAFIYLRPSATTAPPDEFVFEYEQTLAKPDGSGGFSGSPYLYHLRWAVPGRVPADLVRHTRDRDLAVVRSTFAASGPGEQVMKDSDRVRLATPATLTEYYTPDVPWPATVFRAGPNAEGVLSHKPRTYQRGGAPLAERWNVGVFGPAFPPRPAAEDRFVFRFGDTIGANIPLFTDQGIDHAGSSSTDSGGTRLYRNGELIGTTEDVGYGYFDVPGDAATYRLEARGERPGETLSTRVSSAWTFRSGHVLGEGDQPLPVLAVRFAPALNDHNRAPAGRDFAFPVYVQAQPGPAYGKLRALTVEVSYDDGATWRPVKLHGEGYERTAYLRHPSGSGFASLRASATDTLGNTVEQTIIRSYAY
ncbi:S8 family serine peptidase [Plantactinospora mayteni]|uniref:Serine protease n=1 Tax=Plantactinospora mayteni TaxID=566021 RepID=A0ABQ4EVM3_9ACTN|nr:S8 family peptidase [Plantactinospora mayteni]GIG98681.1 serine protease [Plantactinospora mayteni]